VGIREKAKNTKKKREREKKPTLPALTPTPTLSHSPNPSHSLPHSPLFREKHRPDMSEAEAEALLKEALTVCYYRDKQSINKFQIAKIQKTGAAQGGGKAAVKVSVSEPFALETSWDYAAFVNPSKHAVGTW
jgi:hypothetical protein